MTDAPEILVDADIEAVPIDRIIDAVRRFVIADAAGSTTAPPRTVVEFPAGSLVFTVGGADSLAGFRAYETFPSANPTDATQIVAVWDTATAKLKGACFGPRLGALRTGALGGLAVQTLAPPGARTCAVIGSGLQAETQAIAILAVMALQEMRVFSRDAQHRTAFVDRISASGTTTAIVAVDSAKDAILGADIAVLATDASDPVAESDWLRNVSHVTTVGPKLKRSHELPLETIDERHIVSDSPQQIRALGERHMLHGHARWNDVQHLGVWLDNEAAPPAGQTLYLSAGLAGTEVAALDAALSFRRSQRIS